MSKYTATILNKRSSNGTIQHIQGAEWVEVTITKTGEYLGWVPAGALVAHARGQMIVDDLRRVARSTPPPNMPIVEGFENSE